MACLTLRWGVFWWQQGGGVGQKGIDWKQYSPCSSLHCHSKGTLQLKVCALALPWENTLEKRSSLQEAQDHARGWCLIQGSARGLVCST